MFPNEVKLSVEIEIWLQHCLARIAMPTEVVISRLTEDPITWDISRNLYLWRTSFKPHTVHADGGIARLDSFYLF